MVFPINQVDFGGARAYISNVLRVRYHAPVDHLFYAPAHRYRRLAFGSYGFGHTNMRQPGDLRGTVIGRKGRYRVTHARGGHA